MVTALASLHYLTAIAFANGAYPDGLGVLVPTDQPLSVALATNFGIISSQDAGRTWQWGCEQPETTGGILYSLGPPPADRIYAISIPTARSSPSRLASSDDRGCTWHLAGAPFDVVSPVDYFADPHDAQSVLAVGINYQVFPPQNTVYASSDSGKTFPHTLYAAPSGAILTGVEIAQSDARTIYVSMIQGGGGGLWQSSLLRSTDRGVTWSTHDVTSLLGSAITDVRLIAVDHTNASRVFLRVLVTGGEELAIVDADEDGGQTRLRTPIHIAGPLTGFVQRANGTLLVSGLLVPADGTDASAATTLQSVGFQSTDGAMTFTRWPASGALPLLRGMADRNGLLYGAADNDLDGFALGVSSDEGATWVPMMKFSQVDGVVACAASLCLSACQDEANLSLWSTAICAPTDSGLEGDGIDESADETSLPPADTDATSSPLVPSDARGGCGGCAVSGSGRSGVQYFTGAVLAGSFLRRRARKAGVRKSAPRLAVEP